MNEKELKQMKLHSIGHDDQFSEMEILRVVGGWIYYRLDRSTEWISPVGTFVPEYPWL